MVNPDLCRAGGITECRRIAWIADAFGAVWAPHVSTGAAPYLAASMHLAVASPNCVMMEVYNGNKHEGQFGNRLLTAPLDMRPGVATCPTVRASAPTSTSARSPRHGQVTRHAVFTCHPFVRPGPPVALRHGGRQSRGDRRRHRHSRAPSRAIARSDATR